jgi:hypothetical protein
VDPIQTYHLILPDPIQTKHFIHTDPIRTKFKTSIIFGPNSDAAISFSRKQKSSKVHSFGGNVLIPNTRDIITIRNNMPSVFCGFLFESYL